jgi:hypothetical protein
MRRCLAISATVMFLAQVSYARPSGEQSSGQELLQKVKQALRAPGKAWAGTTGRLTDDAPSRRGEWLI